MVTPSYYSGNASNLVTADHHLLAFMQQQSQLQQQNLEMMANLVQQNLSFDNKYVLSDILIFDDTADGCDFETWVLELEKASLMTGIPKISLAFAKSALTPHLTIKRLLKIANMDWKAMYEKLQETYAKLPTDVHASAHINENKQNRLESQEHYFEHFYRSYCRATGTNPAKQCNPHVINTFVRNLYNKDIHRKLANSRIADLQMAFNTALKVQKKVKWIEGYDLHPEFLNDDQNDTKVVNQVSLDTSCSSETQNSKINYVDEHPDSLLVDNTVNGNVHPVQQNQVVKTTPDGTVLDGTK